MLFAAWYFVTLIAVALLMGTTFGHALEMRPKMKLGGVEWMTLQHTLYFDFLYVGAPIELVAMICTAVLCYVVRADTAAFRFALAGSVLTIVAFVVVWLTFTRSANVETATWTAKTIPHDWTRWRTRWEYSHLARFLLHLAAFAALLLSLLAASRFD